MPSVTEHYDSLLAPVYLWMAGGMDAAIARGCTEVDAVCPRPLKGQWAVDLGAGFGMHALPLADLGYSVLAIDSCGALLQTMQRHLGARSIKAVRDDLLSFRRHAVAPVSLILCMGDTLTHLPDRQSIEALFAEVAGCLEKGGTFIVTFRDYSTTLDGFKRFIPVRSDASRILACFLEYGEDVVTVHDILHEREGAEWRMRVSAYRKLRLSPEWVVRSLKAKGFEVRDEPSVTGMTRIIAQRPG